MQFDQKIVQYHLTGTDNVIAKRVISHESIAVKTPWGAKQRSIIMKFCMTPDQSQKKTFRECFHKNDT